jgi:Flp pilus assembly protein TadB
MANTQLLIILIALIALGGFGVLLYLLSGSHSEEAGIRELMGSGSGADLPARRIGRDGNELDVEEIKRRSGTSKNRKTRGGGEDLQTKLFRAGFYTQADRKRFLIMQVVALVFLSTSLPLGIYKMAHSPLLTVLTAVIGLFAGYAMPISWLEKQIRNRQEEVMYYLPLVVEQVSIGVSSSLDIGPCIANIVEMADQRDSHNPVTEMFVHVEKLMRSGLNLEDSLIEVGTASAMTETKHAFMFLAQCAKHGGEVTKQLQELADSVMTAREVQVEGKITSLPVKATGPLITVFAGFFALLFAGLMVRLMSAFGG